MNQLPQRDKTKPAEQQGLFQKFIVTRTDGKDAPGQKHCGCEYFVLDATHDIYAKAALAAYAAACAESHPDLSNDLLQRYALPLPEVSDKPVAYMRHRFAQSLDTNGYCDGHEWLEVCSEGEQGEDGEPAFPVYATPRPYIPQDIREAVEENEALRKENKRLSSVDYCFNEWLEKTEWVQKTVQPHELGMHRADVLKNRIDALREVLKETLDLLEYNADYFPESGAEDRSTIAKIKAVLGETRVKMSGMNDGGAA